MVADGLEPLLRSTVIGLAERGHQVRVVGAAGPHELGPEDRFRLGRSVEVIGGEPGGSIRTTARAVRRVMHAATNDPSTLRMVAERTRRAHGAGARFRARMASYLPILEWPADVVYFEAAYVAAEHAAVLDRLPPKVVMCTGSDVRIMPDENPWLERALPGTFATMIRVVCRSEELAGWAVRRGAPPDRVSVLPVAADARTFAPTGRPPRPGDALRLVSVGRLHWVKGYETAVEAVARARARGADVTYTIVGENRGSRAAVEFAIRDLGLDDVVTVAGQRSVDGVRAALARSDVFVLPSLSEGMSRAAVEAMAMGLPVVTTDAGGMTELVTDGVEGIVVARRDPDALAEAFVVMAADEARRRAMGEAATRRAAEYDFPTLLDATERLLLDAAATRVAGLDR